MKTPTLVLLFFVFFSCKNAGDSENIYGKVKGTKWQSAKDNQYLLSFTFNNDSTFLMTDETNDITYDGKYVTQKDTVFTIVDKMVGNPDSVVSPLHDYAQKLVLKDTLLYLVFDQLKNEKAATYSKPDRFMKIQQ